MTQIFIQNQQHPLPLVALSHQNTSFGFTPITSPIKNDGKKPSQQSNQLKILVKTYENPDKENDWRVEVEVAGRPPSGVGSKTQGDHTTAFVMFVEDTEKHINGHKPEEAFRRLLWLVDNYVLLLDQASNLVTNALQKESAMKQSTMSVSDLEKMRTSLNNELLFSQMSKSVTKGNAAFYSELIGGLVNQLLTNMNKNPLASFAREGQPKPTNNEGARIRIAKEELHKINDKLGKNERLLKTELKNIIKYMAETLHYPAINQQQALSEQDKENIKQDKGYKSREVFRDNDITQFATIIGRHIALIIDIYKNFDVEGGIKAIREVFVKKLVTEGSWMKESKNPAWRHKPSKQRSY